MKQYFQVLVALLVVVVVVQFAAGSTTKDLKKICTINNSLSAKEIAGIYNQMLDIFKGKSGLVNLIDGAKGNFDIQISDARDKKVLGKILAEHTETICAMYNSILDVLAETKQRDELLKILNARIWNEDSK